MLIFRTIGVGHLPEEKQIDTVLLTLSTRQNLLSQRATASRCLFNLWETIADVLPWAQITASSAYIWKSAPWHESGRSLINILKSIGPYTDPCGIPVFVFKNDDFALLMATHCSRFERYDLNQATVFSAKL